MDPDTKEMLKMLVSWKHTGSCYYMNPGGSCHIGRREPEAYFNMNDDRSASLSGGKKKKSLLYKNNPLCSQNSCMSETAAASVKST